MNSPLVPGKFVRVRISATNVEIGQLLSVDYKDNKATVETRSGFTISCRKSQIEPVMLVVCDLNGVLGSRRKKNDFLKRPDLDTFIPFLLNNFVVGIWSSCIRRNGEDIVRDCFAHFESQLLFTYFRDECTPAPTKENPYATIKDLNRLWSQYPQSFDQSNTIIIDDSDEKCSHRFNALCPTPFDEKEISGSKIGLMELIDTLRQVNNVNCLDPLRPLMLRRAELMRELRDAEESKREDERRKEEERISREEAGKLKGVLTLASGSQVSFSSNGGVCDQQQQQNQTSLSSTTNTTAGGERSILSFFEKTVPNTTTIQSTTTKIDEQTKNDNDDNVFSNQQQQQQQPPVDVVSPPAQPTTTTTTTTSKFMKLTTISSSSSGQNNSIFSGIGGTSNNTTSTGFDMNKLLSIVNGTSPTTPTGPGPIPQTTTTNNNNNNTKSSSAFTVTSTTTTTTNNEDHHHHYQQQQQQDENLPSPSSSHHQKKTSNNNYHHHRHSHHHNNNRRPPTTQNNTNGNNNNNNNNQQQQQNKPHYQRRSNNKKNTGADA